MAENNPLDPVQSSFFYANAPANSPLSYQSLLTRRKIAEALLSKRTALPFPKNLGEGLTYASDRLASAFGDKTELERLEAAQRAYDVQGERDVQSAAKTLYGGGAASAPDRRSDAGTETEQTASGVPPVPYVPSGEGSVPIPPPRPVVDRSPILNDANDPATARRLAAMTLGEAESWSVPGRTADTICHGARPRISDRNYIAAGASNYGGIA